MKLLSLALLLFAPALRAQDEGLWQGYDGEWDHVSRQLIALAQATPEDKFAWSPAPGVRTTAQVYMHIVGANYWLLQNAGTPPPSDFKQEMDNQPGSKADVLRWLQRSLDAVKTARAALKPAGLQRHVKILGRDAPVDGIYLRILIHANEHMGQLVAYARSTGVVPPWSK